jgi:hypothetical protein
MVEDQQIRADLRGPQIDGRKFAPADQIFRIDLRTVLNLRVEYRNAAGFGQLPELFERGFGAREGIFFHPHQDGFFRGVNFASFLLFGKLIFECGDEGQKVEINPVRLLWLVDQPVIALRIFGNQMRPEQFAGRSVFMHLERSDHVQTQMR